MIAAKQQMLLGVVKGATLLLFERGEVDLPLGVLGMHPFRYWLVTPLDVVDVSLRNI